MVAKLHLMSANFSNHLAPEAAESSSGRKTLGRDEIAVRDKEMGGQVFRSGQTLKTVGERFGLTRERARQILAKCGICKLDGGSHFSGHRRTLPLPRNKGTERWLEINGNLVATGRRVAG